jgi:hypothetical protein
MHALSVSKHIQFQRAILINNKTEKRGAHKRLVTNQRDVREKLGGCSSPIHSFSRNQK